MNLSSLETILSPYPVYRLTQAKKAIFKELIDNWSETTTFPINLREELNQACPLTIDSEVFESTDKRTTKIRLKLKDNLEVESVLMRHNDERNVVCVSSQIGCPLACRFCATGKMGFKRNLIAEEIWEQVLFFSRYLKKEGKRVSGIVFMGMGEPFLNYDQLIKAIHFLNNSETFDIGARHISISTVGISEGIQKLSQENLQVNLAISLHAPNNQLRSQIMPVNEKYPLEAIFKEVDEYIKKTKRKVMFEYLLIGYVNDSEECAHQLAKLMKKKLYFLNLMTYNPTGQFQPSSNEKISRFKEILVREKIIFSERYRFGQKLKAACGQLIIDKHNP